MKPILFLVLASIAIAGCGEADYDKISEPVVSMTSNDSSSNKGSSAGNNNSNSIDSSSINSRKNARHTTRIATSHYCNYPTRKGRPCKRIVQGASGYCWQHSR